MHLFSRAHEVSSFSNNISRRTLSILPLPLFLTSIDCDKNCESFATAARNSPEPSSVGPSLRVHACYSKRTRHHHAHPQPVDSIFRWHTNRLSTRRGVPLFYISQQSSSFTTSILPAPRRLPPKFSMSSLFASVGSPSVSLLLRPSRRRRRRLARRFFFSLSAANFFAASRRD